MTYNHRWFLILLMLFAFSVGLTPLPGNLSIACSDDAQQTSNDGRAQAKSELDQGVCAYQTEDYASAQRHFERALELDPTQKKLPIFIAHAIYSQYRERVQTPENIEKARAAIAAYEKVLAKDPANHIALYQIINLYDQIKPEELLKLATSERLSKEDRAFIYWRIGNNCWQCSLGITSQKEVQHNVQKDGKDIIQYKKPGNPADFNKAQDCARRGLEALEESIRLNPNEANIWYYKSFLLREMAKLAEMEGKTDETASYNKQADEMVLVYKRMVKQQEASTKPEETKATAGAEKKESDRSPTEEIADFIKSGTLKRAPKIDPETIVVPALSLATPAGGEAPPAKKDAARAPELPWKRFAPNDENFTVQMPSPVESADGLTGPAYTAKSDGIDYTILSMEKSDPPPGIAVNDSSVLAYAAAGSAQAVCNFLSNLGEYTCEVRFVRKLTLSNYLGSHYVIKATKCGGSISGVLRLYVTNDRIYMLQILGANEDDPRASRFLQSFTAKR